MDAGHLDRLATRDAHHRPSRTPHPGAQLHITDHDGWHITVLATNTIGGRIAHLEVRYQLRDRSWGPDAHEFNPDRFPPENLRKPPPYTYKPFGTGPRACIGRQFALHEMVLALAMIVHQFTFEPRPGYRLEVAETMTLKPKDLQLRLHRR
ncbi:cytochrome P450 [Mycobacterium haemophilum]|uniref:cytochrome P450 n=1 Tax=Mycobacterium haemophilum TaxID=29311 RepID=UPI000699A08B